jgi:hypothetical protein
VERVIESTSAAERLGLEDEGGEELGLEVAGLPELEGQVVIEWGRLDLLGECAEVAERHAELVLGDSRPVGPDLGVVLAASVVAKGLELCEDFFDGHGGMIQGARGVGIASANL